MVRRTRNRAKLCDPPPCARGMPRAQPRPKTSASTTPSQNRPAEKGENEGCAIALVGGWGEVGPPDSEWGQIFTSGLLVPAGCPRHSRAQKRSPEVPLPKTAQRKRAKTRGGAIALVGGWGEVGPPDSDWAQTLRAASVCPRDALGTAAPKNKRPNYPVPKLPSGKGPKRGVCYSLGGGVGLSWSAGHGMGPNFASGLRVPAGCPGHSRAQKRAPEGHRPKTAERKRAKTGGGQ